MIAQVAIAALALSGGVFASEMETINQLETPRLTQAAQRAEFGPEGPDSAFKFSFSDPVRFPANLVFRNLSNFAFAFFCSFQWSVCAVVLCYVYNWLADKAPMQ